MRADVAIARRRRDEVAEAELGTATYGREVRRGDDPALASRARRPGWRPRHRAQREMVVISDFQRGAIDAPAIASVPEQPACRVVRWSDCHRAAIRGRRAAGVRRTGDTRTQTIELTADATAVRIAREPRWARDGYPDCTAAGADGCCRVAARAGTPAGDRQQPIDRSPFRALSPARSLRSLTSVACWLDAAHRAAAPGEPGALPRRGCAGATARRRPRSTRGSSVVARSATAKPLLWAAASGDELVLDVAAPSDSLFAAQVVRAALIARVTTDRYRRAGDSPDRQRHVGRVGSARAGAGRRSAWHSVETTDARWCWRRVADLPGRRAVAPRAFDGSGPARRWRVLPDATRRRASRDPRCRRVTAGRLAETDESARR